MTAVVDLQPDTGSTVVACVAEIHRLLDTVDTHTAVAGGDYAGLIGDTERAVSRLEALKLSLLAAADQASVAEATGMSGTSAWLAKHTRTSGGAAAGQVALATALTGLPATGAALAEGDLSTDHAAVIAATTKRLPARLDAAERDAIEHRLVEQAKTLDPTALRRRARRALEAAASRAETDRHHDRVLREEESAAHTKTRLRLHDNGDGTLTGHFTVPVLAGSILRKAVQQLTSPRRGRAGATGAQAGPSGDQIDWSRRYGEAFAELMEHLPTDRLHGKVAATVVITLDHDQLLHDLRGARLDTAEEISAGEARRLACSAGILPAILDGESQPLDLGHTKRFFTEAQRVALATRHTTCAADGCDRPYAWSDLHHRHPWSAGGPTDLREAIPLCGFHHRRIHDPAYHHHEDPHGAIHFHARR